MTIDELTALVEDRRPPASEEQIRAFEDEIGARLPDDYFWDHEEGPGGEWDGTVAAAENITLLARSFTDFVAGLRRGEDASPP